MILSPRHLFSCFFREEEAQATIEYILILSVLVSIAILLVRDFIRPIMTRLNEYITQLIDEKMFESGSNMHRLPFKR